MSTIYSHPMFSTACPPMPTHHPKPFGGTQQNKVGGSVETGTCMHASMPTCVSGIGPSSPTAFAFVVDMQPTISGRDDDFTPRMHDITRMYRAQLLWMRMDAGTQRVYHAHRRFDDACTHLAEMEIRTGLLHRLMPGGPNQGVRKTLGLLCRERRQISSRSCALQWIPDTMSQAAGHLYLDVYSN